MRDINEYNAPGAAQCVIFAPFIIARVILSACSKVMWRDRESRSSGVWAPLLRLLRWFQARRRDDVIPRAACKNENAPQGERKKTNGIHAGPDAIVPSEAG